jgi:1-deoxy-D-xylulose-5-phosphate reductoisomerase
MKALTILGSTGSIGCNTLRVVEAHPSRLRVVGLAAGSNVELLAQQIQRHRPAVVSVASAAARDALGRLIDLSSLRVGVGEAGMCEAATHPDAQLVVAAAVGALGLVPTYRALQAGKDVALANKETLVMAGVPMVAEAERRGARILPIDSEHCALHQCLDGRRPEEVRRLVLTASGGPFRNRPGTSFHAITPAEALQHPTWSMGRKITIDSATLMNKGLEVIEARWLFGAPPERVDVLIHPQSIVHSLVEFVDGSLLAQLGVTDMRVPIQYALGYPERWDSALPRLDLGRSLSLEFEPPDRERFPCLELAYRAIGDGGACPAVLNAANEEAVQAFLDERIPFPAIPDCVAEVLGGFDRGGASSLEDVLAADAWSRRNATAVLSQAASRAAH